MSIIKIVLEDLAGIPLVVVRMYPLLRVNINMQLILILNSIV